MSGYGLTLFGGFALHDGSGAPVAVRSKKSRCLLAYLALAKGKEVDRDVLAGLLWGDRDDSHARHSLSQELYRLRGLFSENAQSAFQLATDTVGFARDLLDVDVLRFERGVASDSAEAKAEAAALYAGDLLAGLETGQEGFDDWLRTERERLRDRAIAALHDVVRAQRDGPPEPAIESASRLLTIDPTNEDAHRALMQLHANSGRRDLALRQYEKCKDVLQTELGIAPDTQTRKLYEMINSASQTPEAATDERDARESEPMGDVAISDPPLPLPSKPSIAVLPFTNMSGDPEQVYFSDGIADDIITGLSRFRDLFVISRNSSFTYKGSAVDIKRVGRELGVRYVLVGGVRKAGKRVRITTQLIEAESGKHLWAETYDGDLADIFDLQDEITNSVVGAVQPTVFRAEIERVRRKHPENIGAYEWCMKGWAHEVELDQHSLVQARRCFVKAIELDSRLPRAYTGLAGVSLIETVRGWSADPHQSMADAKQAAQKAVTIDEGDAEAHTWLSSSFLFFDGRLDVALAEAERAVELSPNNAMARNFRSVAYCFDGRPDEGITEAKMALRLSPRDWFRVNFLHHLALSEYTARDYSAAAETATKVVALNPDYPYGHWHLAGSCAQLGQLNRARAELGELLRIIPVLDREFVVSVAPYGDPADLEHLIEGLRKAGWEG